MDFDAFLQHALSRIPEDFQRAIDNVPIIVEDWPDPRTMEEVTGDRDEVLYGLFVGTPLPDRSFGDWGEVPAMIFLYRKPLEEDYPDPEDLAKQIEITLAHEIAHYLGFDEDTLSEYGYE